MFSSFPCPRYRLLTSNGAMDDGTIFQLDRDRLVVELHQKPIWSVMVYAHCSAQIHSFALPTCIQSHRIPLSHLLFNEPPRYVPCTLVNHPEPLLSGPSTRPESSTISSFHDRFLPFKFHPSPKKPFVSNIDLPDELHFERRSLI